MARRKKRNELVAHYYPDKVTAEEFIKTLKEDSKMFLENMKGIKAEPAYVEEWVDLFFKWMEMKRP